MDYIYKPNNSGRGNIESVRNYTYHRKMVSNKRNRFSFNYRFPQYHIPWRTLSVVGVCIVAMSILAFGGIKTKEYIVARRNTARAAELAQQEAEAQSKEKEIREQAKTAKAALELGNQYEKDGNLSDACFAYKVALEYDPNWRDAYLKLAVIELRERDYSAAEEALNHALSIDPINPTTHHLLAILYEKTERSAAAQASNTKANELASSMGLEIGG